MTTLMDIQARYRAVMGDDALPERARRAALQQAGYLPAPNTERGYRPTPENRLKYLYRTMWVDPDLRAAILDVREMDRTDPRVKRIHGRTARAAVKGGLALADAGNSKVLKRHWRRFVQRLRLDRREKLESDMRGLMMEGNLPLQWVVGPEKRVAGAIRMPSETIVPRVGPHGQFLDPRAAYDQYDVSSGAVIHTFPLWQLSMVRLTPDNYDDFGSLGRPYLDATRTVWRKLVMTEEDLVIRRRERAPLRTAHFLEGAGEEELAAYKAEVEDDQKEITTNYYSNKKGSVQAIQGDANLDQIADVGHLLDTFFSGAPAPKGLFGYGGDLQRDILEDLKQDFYDELDALQDSAAFVYELGFRFDLLLAGLNPDSFDFRVRFAERRTETPNQAADRALKLQAMGASKQTIWETSGLDTATELARRNEEAKANDPYPEPAAGGGRVSVTPGNRRKGESGTDITTRS